MRSRDFVDIMEVMLEADVAQKLELVFRRKATRTFEASSISLGSEWNLEIVKC